MIVSRPWRLVMTLRSWTQGKSFNKAPSRKYSAARRLRAIAGSLAVETILHGRVLENSSGLVTVAIVNRTLTALAPELPPDTSSVNVCIRAEDVILTKDSSLASSPRNQLRVTIRKLVLEGPMMRIELDCGFLLTAYLTKQACEELQLKEGESAHCPHQSASNPSHSIIRVIFALPSLCTSVTTCNHFRRVFCYF